MDSKNTDEVMNLPKPEKPGASFELPAEDKELSEQEATQATEQRSTPTASPSTHDFQSPVSANPTIDPVSDPSVFADQTPLIADDADLIEKEWVMRAKSIVERTKHDPHSQNKEITKVKAEYLRKRYDKELKAEDSQTK